MKRTATINGQQVDLYNVEPLNVNEQWNTYLMPNGDMLRIKQVMTKIFQSDKRNDNGEMLYQWDFKTVVDIVKGDK